MQNITEVTSFFAGLVASAVVVAMLLLVVGAGRLLSGSRPAARSETSSPTPATEVARLLRRSITGRRTPHRAAHQH